MPAWKLVQKRATRKFKDAVASVAKLLKLDDVKKEDLYTVPQPKTVAQCEKVVGKGAFAKLCADDVVAISSGTTLVHEGDKRAAVTPAGGLRRLAEQTAARQLQGGK